MTVPHETPFADLLRQRSGLTLPVDRFAQCLRRLGYSDMESAYDTLRALPFSNPAWQRVLRELSIGETYFFRDVEPLEMALREVIARRRDSRTVTIWSAGCSTGEETYTLAMLLRENLPDAAWQAAVIGTDINESALTTAQRAVYGAWSMRGQDSRVRGAFVPCGDRWQVADPVRQIVSFRLLNLADEYALFPEADLIVCRNVFMYWDSAVQSQVRGRLISVLNAGGILLLDGTRIHSSKMGSLAKATLSHVEPVHRSKGWATAPLSKNPPEKRTVFNTLYDQARAAADQHNWAAAHRLLDTAPPLDLPCGWLRALIYQQQHVTDEAIEAIGRCLYIDPRFALGYFTLGNLYAAQGNWKQARREWANTMRLIATYQASDMLPLGEGITAGEVAEAIRAASGAGDSHV